MPIFVISGQLNGSKGRLCSDIRQYVGETAELGINPDSVVVIVPKQDCKAKNLVVTILNLTERLTDDGFAKVMSGIEHIVRYYIGNERSVRVRVLKFFNSRCTV